MDVKVFAGGTDKLRHNSKAAKQDFHFQSRWRQEYNLSPCLKYPKNGQNISNTGLQGTEC